MSYSEQAYQLSAVALRNKIAKGQMSATEATEQVLQRISAVNPHYKALASVNVEAALQQANFLDAKKARGEPMGVLHGVPVTIKINVDVAGEPTTDGVVAAKDNVAIADSPLVGALKQADAVIVGRTNAPAFSLRWFCDNDLHGQTLNPFDASRTPGGSSGGAAAATALGMGAIAHGNDYGGSIRYPAWACGVVGLRTTVGRIPSYKASLPNRVISNQLMSVQGPLTRSVADAALALKVMSQPSALDPQWTPAPLDFAHGEKPCKVALFAHWGHSSVHPSVNAALEQAAKALSVAGYVVEEAAPPQFLEATQLWRQLVVDDLRRGAWPAIMQLGDVAVKTSVTHLLGQLPQWTRDEYLQGLTERFNIARQWALFFEQYPVLLMPNCWEPIFAVGEDLKSQPRFEEMLLAQSPMLSTALLGLPGLSVPTGLHNGLPTGVQLVADRFREDRLLAAGAVIEQALPFSALAYLQNKAAQIPRPSEMSNNKD